MPSSSTSSLPMKVASMGVSVATGAIDLLGRALGGVFPDVHHRDLRAFASKQHGARLPDPRAGSGHQRHLVLELHGDSPLNSPSGHLRARRSGMSALFGSGVF